MAVVLSLRPPICLLVGAILFSFYLAWGERRGRVWFPSLLLGTGGGGVKKVWLPGTTGEASMMAVVLGIRPPKMDYIDKSNGSPCLGRGGGKVCIILPTHLFLHTTYLAKSFKVCICIQTYGIQKFAWLWYWFVSPFILHACDIFVTKFCFQFFSMCFDCFMCMICDMSNVNFIYFV